MKIWRPIDKTIEPNERHVLQSKSNSIKRKNCFDNQVTFFLRRITRTLFSRKIFKSTWARKLKRNVVCLPWTKTEGILRERKENVRSSSLLGWNVFSIIRIINRIISQCKKQWIYLLLYFILIECFFHQCKWSVSQWEMKQRKMINYLFMFGVCFMMLYTDRCWNDEHFRHNL